MMAYATTRYARRRAAGMCVRCGNRSPTRACCETCRSSEGRQKRTTGDPQRVEPRRPFVPVVVHDGRGRPIGWSVWDGRDLPEFETA